MRVPYTSITFGSPLFLNSNIALFNRWNSVNRQALPFKGSGIQIQGFCAPYMTRKRSSRRKEVNPLITSWDICIPVGYFLFNSYYINCNYIHNYNSNSNNFLRCSLTLKNLGWVKQNFKKKVSFMKPYKYGNQTSPIFMDDIHV